MKAFITLSPPHTAPREHLKQELDRFSNIGVIRKVDKLTNWISALEVTTKKNGSYLAHCVLTQNH